METTVEEYNGEEVGLPPVAFQNAQGRVFKATANLIKQQRKMKLTPLTKMPASLLPKPSAKEEQELADRIAAEEAANKVPANPLADLGQQALKQGAKRKAIS